MKSRKFQNIVQQRIDCQNLVRYVDNLKTRIYKAFLKKSRLYFYYLQSFCVNSPLVIFAAAKHYTQLPDNRINSFELAYLAFSLSRGFNFDISFYFYYKETFIADIELLFGWLPEKTKLTIANWCIDSCQAAGLPGKKISFYDFNNVGDLNSFICRKVPSVQYVFYLDIRSCFSYLYLRTLVKKLYLDRSITSYLLQWLSDGIFNYVMFSFGTLCSSAMFIKDNIELGFFRKLLCVFTFIVCSEISAMFFGLNSLRKSIEDISFLHYRSVVLILHNDPLQLNNLLNELRSFVLFGGIKLASNLFAYSLSLFDTMTCDLLFISSCNKLYTVAIRPSLHSQFTLMDRASSLLCYSVSQPLFLSIIRLNKLLLIWSNIYFDYRIGKIFYLIDYLVYVKLSLLLRKQDYCLDGFNCTLSLSSRFGKNIDLDYSKSNNLIVVSVSTHDFYSHYIFTRIFWIYLLKCLSD